MSCCALPMGDFPGVYATETTSRNTDETGIFLANANELKRVPVVPENYVNCWEMFQQSVSKFGNNPFLGRRVVRADGSLGEYVYQTYKETEAAARVMGSAIMEKGLCPLRQFPDEEYAPCREMRTLGIFAKNRPEWVITEQACFAFNIVLVPLYDTLGIASMNHIVTQTEMSTVVISAECVPQLLKLIQQHNNRLITHLVLLEKLDSTTLEEITGLGICVTYMGDILAESGGREPSPATSREAPAAICYTSGTTNLPKGVILTHGNILATLEGTLGATFNPAVSPLSGLSEKDIHFSYLPLAHVLERLVISAFTAIGASVGFYSGDQLKLLEDVAVCEPTLFCAVPRVFNRIHEKLFITLNDKSYLARGLFDVASWWKFGNLRQSKQFHHILLDQIVFKKIRRLLGSRLRFMICGGAPLSSEMQEWMQILFSCPIVQGYGMSETFGPAFVTHAMDPTVGTVGGPILDLQFKIVSAPAIEYVVAEGARPRGELCMRGPSVFKGYFRNKEETRESLDADGWLHSGDIAEIQPDQAVKIIDRKKNIFKLSQGEYVSPEKIENVYVLAGPVAQCFVYGNSFRTYCVAIVVPAEDAGKQWATEHDQKGELKTLCKDNQFKAYVRKEMEDAAHKSGLKGFEQVREFTMIPDMFTVDNGLLTPTMKLIRHTAAKTFTSEINRMYSLSVN